MLHFTLGAENGIVLKHLYIFKKYVGLTYLCNKHCNTCNKPEEGEMDVKIYTHL